MTDEAASVGDAPPGWWQALRGQARRRDVGAQPRRVEADPQATRHTALQHIATLVATGTDLHPAVVVEIARGLGVEHVALVRFDSGESCTVLAAHDLPDSWTFEVGERLSLKGDGILGHVWRSGSGAPVTVDGATRGALIVGSTRGELPPNVQEWIGDFADLVAIAFANADARAALNASRARLVATADAARRRFERDLDGGVRQRVAALGLGLRTVEASVSAEDQTVRQQLDNVINGLADLYTELQELSRAMYPASLTTSGLGPALRGLARRSVVPVSVDVDVDRRLSESTELAAYYVVAEALTNAALHSQASHVTVRVRFDADGLHVAVVDDGIGGAGSTGGGAGLVGLADRVEALSGRFTVTSPPGEGTTLTATIPGDSPA